MSLDPRYDTERKPDIDEELPVFACDFRDGEQIETRHLHIRKLGYVPLCAPIHYVYEVTVRRCEFIKPNNAYRDIVEAMENEGIETGDADIRIYWN